MARKIRKIRKTKPIFYIFCEGDSEKSYIKCLKGKYRKPINIKIEKKNSINKSKIESYFKDKNFDNEKDKIFLMYDLDIQDTFEKLKEIKEHYNNKIKNNNVILLVSNPCFELWYLLHFKAQTANISTENCEKALKNFYENYKKGEVPKNLEVNLEKAIQRAENLTQYENPSTEIYKIIKILKGIL